MMETLKILFSTLRIIIQTKSDIALENLALRRQLAILKNHMYMCSVYFFTVPTATFQVLFVLVILSHSRRKVIHFKVTAHPTTEWAAQQIVLIIHPRSDSISSVEFSE